MMKEYPNLFRPITIAGTMFRNRIFAAPTGYVDVYEDGRLPGEAALYYERKARGGAASVALGECNVDSQYGAGTANCIHLDNPHTQYSLAKITEAVRCQGAVCSAELQHAGAFANRFLDPPGIAYGPVACENNGRQVLEMPEEIIWNIVEKYAKAAAFAQKCGFGMITLHAGHGWLLSQFLSPDGNTRHDKWGGPSIENRARLTVTVLDAIRKAVGPRMPIEVRISGSECYDGGYGIEEGIAFARQLDGHADLIHVSAGSHEIEEVFTVTHPSMFLEDGCNVKYAAEIKKHVSSYVATVGALGDPDLMEEIIASGQADVVEIARGLIADPDLPNKIRTGKGSEINKCMRCLACFSNLMNCGEFKCAINPKTGREAVVNHALPPAEHKKVLIAGGGVAGMQAALTCAECGHTVILCEKTHQLGGALRCEEHVPFKANLDQYLNRQAKLVADAGVEIRLDTEVTPALVEKSDADVLIVAMGAQPLKPPIKGIDGSNVIAAEDAYLHPEQAGGTVMILGAGLVGTELGIYLSMLGKRVSIVEMADKINDGGNFLHVKSLKTQISKYGIPIHYHTTAKEITENGVVCESGGKSLFFEADTVIYALGQKPLQEQAAALSYCTPVFYAIGDCLAPRNIMNATSTAFTTANSIGQR